MAATKWATVSDVKTLTGRTVTEDERTRAVATLETHLGLIESVERTDISDRDRHFLKLATCYQAAWLAAQPDAFERNDVTSASQDGESATYRPDAHTLAPNARKAMRRLSWKGKRVIGVPTSPRKLSVLSEEFDDLLPWRPM